MASSAQIIDQFLEYEPNEGAESRFRTEARVTYDDRYLYVLARMYDPAPDSIVSLLSRRDVRTHSEQLKLVIDSYHDKKTAFQFIVNPAGVKRDFYVYNDNDEDASWDAVWDVATKIDSLGWVAEFRIPFSQIRFAPGNAADVRLHDRARRRAHRAAHLVAAAQPQGARATSRRPASSSGIGGLPTPRRLEIAPYAVAKNSTRDFGEARAGGLARYEHPSQLTVGADLKYGLSSNLTLDATINPDFGQVEADPAQLNLTAFETVLRRAPAVLPRRARASSASTPTAATSTADARACSTRAASAASRSSRASTATRPARRRHRSPAPPSSRAGSPTGSRSACSMR